MPMGIVTVMATAIVMVVTGVNCVEVIHMKAILCYDDMMMRHWDSAYTEIGGQLKRWYYVQFQIKMARISNSLVPHTPTPSQGRRRNRYRPSCLIRDFLKAASTDTAQITSTENQLCFSFICHPFFFIVSCMKECESIKLETEK